MDKLALLGGSPVRKRPFDPSVVIDETERSYINKVIDRKEFSRFMGSPSTDIGKLLTMTSSGALHHENQYFSFLGGKMVRRFEADFAEKFKVPYAMTVNSATTGLAAALGAVGVGPGDEVITTCLSFNATALSILFFNAVPVFVDVDENTFCLDPRKVEETVTKKTKAILAVHLLGHAADMDAIMGIAARHGLKVIEDCAQAPGTKYKGRYAGTIGDAGVFSFQETKNITTGEGGMVVTKDAGIAKKVRLIRNHGESVPDDKWDQEELANIIGMNFRMTELTAALGVAQMEKLDDNNRIRTDNSRYLARKLKGLPGLTMPEFDAEAVPHIFAMVYDKAATGVERKKILAALRAEGIPVGSGYVRAMYENPVFLKKIAYGKENCPWSCAQYGIKREYNHGDCPVAEKYIRDRFIWFYHINRPNTSADMDDVAKAFKKVFNDLKTLNESAVDKEMAYKW